MSKDKNFGVVNSDIAQGYLFSRPVPREDVPALLLRHAAQQLGARPLQAKHELRQKQSTMRVDFLGGGYLRYKSPVESHGALKTWRSGM